MLQFYVSKELPHCKKYPVYVVVHFNNSRPYRIYDACPLGDCTSKWTDFKDSYNDIFELEENFRQVEVSECSESDKIFQSLITGKEFFKRLEKDSFNEKSFLGWYTGPHVNDYDKWIDTYLKWLTFEGNETELEKIPGSDFNAFDFRVYSTNEGFKIYEDLDVLPKEAVFVKSFRFRIDANNFIMGKKTKKENNLITVMGWIADDKQVLRSSDNGESWSIFDPEKDGVSNDYIYKLAKVYKVTVMKRVVAESKDDAYEVLKSSLSKEDIIKIEQM